MASRHTSYPHHHQHQHQQQRVVHLSPISLVFVGGPATLEDEFQEVFSESRRMFDICWTIVPTVLTLGILVKAFKAGVQHETSYIMFGFSFRASILLLPLLSAAFGWRYSSLRPWAMATVRLSRIPQYLLFWRRAGIMSCFMLRALAWDVYIGLFLAAITNQVLFKHHVHINIIVAAVTLSALLGPRGICDAIQQAAATLGGGGSCSALPGGGGAGAARPVLAAPRAPVLLPELCVDAEQHFGAWGRWAVRYLGGATLEDGGGEGGAGGGAVAAGPVPRDPFRVTLASLVACLGCLVPTAATWLLETAERRRFLASRGYTPAHASLGALSVALLCTAYGLAIFLSLSALL